MSADVASKMPAELLQAPAEVAPALLPQAVRSQRLSKTEVQSLQGLAEVEGTSILALFLSSRADSAEALSDLATVVMLQTAQGELKVSHAQEIRKWAELVYSMVVVGGSDGTMVNYIEQLNVLAQGLE
mgnify:CR=1 FL=1